MYRDCCTSKSITVMLFISAAVPNVFDLIVILVIDQVTLHSAPRIGPSQFIMRLLKRTLHDDLEMVRQLVEKRQGIHR